MSLLGDKVRMALTPNVLGFMPTDALAEMKEILNQGIMVIDGIISRRETELKKAKEKV